jgi:hypothetical protein
LERDELTQVPLDEQAQYVQDFAPSPDGGNIAITGTCLQIPDSACIFNMNSMELTLLERHSQSWGYLSEFYWHQDNNWVFKAEVVSVSTRLISVSNADGTIQRELTTCVFSASCFGWLPEIFP